MNTTTKKKFIDIENVIRDKNPNLLKVLPGFVINYIKKILHEEQINRFIEQHGDKYNIEFAEKILSEFGAKVEIIGEENIPASGGFILASNHPLGGLDAMALVKAVGKKRVDIKFIVNDILMSLENLKSIFVPVNKHGKNSAESLEELDNLYKSDQAILIFPAGLVSRKQKGEIKDLEWKKSFITKAKKYSKTIIPVYIDAKNSPFFYNFALWRKRLGIKANIEMFYLVNEMYKQNNKTIKLIFGKPIPFQLLDNKHNNYVWAQKVKEHVYALASGNKSNLLV